jgi:hypothetical protein
MKTTKEKIWRTNGSWRKWFKRILVNSASFIIGYANLSKLTPPEFKVNDITEIVSIYIISQKRGTSGFCQGLIQGGKMYNTPLI